MRLIFAGTPEFAARVLSALLESRHEVRLVLTQPDRPAGRGLRVQPSPVKRRAAHCGVRVEQPPTLKDEGVLSMLRAAEADLMVVVAYGLILPQSVLSIPGLGAVNVHASLLPRWRGAAPIQRALLAGDRRTGVCVIQMDAGLDTGPVLVTEAVDIDDQDDAQSLHKRLADLGVDVLARALDDLESGKAVPRPQAAEEASYASKIERAEALIDWHRPAAEIWCKVRAFNPHPGAGSRLGQADLKIWRASPALQTGSPGTVLEAGSHGILVACGAGSLRIEELQRAGGRRLKAAEFLRGQRIEPGDRLGN